MTPAHGFHLTTSVSLAALLLLCLSWELWFAPLRPGGSWLALKVLPLMWIAPGIVRGKLYTHRASTMLILAYFAEGVVRGYTEQGLGAGLAMAEITLSVVFFAAAIAYVRARRKSPPATPQAAPSA